MNSGAMLHIRDGRPADRPAVQQLSLAAYGQYATTMPHWAMYREHMLATLAEDGPADLIVAELNGVVVGSVLLFPPTAAVYADDAANAGWPEVRLLAVAPATRGHGIAKALLEECIRRARQAGATDLGLHTEDIMSVATHLYTARGFVRAPAHDFTPAPGVVVKSYRLPLTPVAT